MTELNGYAVQEFNMSQETYLNKEQDENFMVVPDLYFRYLYFTVNMPDITLPSETVNVRLILFNEKSIVLLSLNKNAKK